MSPLWLSELSEKYYILICPLELEKILYNIIIENTFTICLYHYINTLEDNIH